MEVQESATCSVANREFLINVDEAEMSRLYERLRVASEAMPNDEFLEDLMKQIEMIAGVALR